MLRILRALSPSPLQSGSRRDLFVSVASVTLRSPSMSTQKQPTRRLASPESEGGGARRRRWRVSTLQSFAHHITGAADPPTESVLQLHQPTGMLARRLQCTWVHVFCVLAARARGWAWWSWWTSLRPSANRASSAVEQLPTRLVCTWHDCMLLHWPLAFNSEAIVARYRANGGRLSRRNTARATLLAAMRHSEGSKVAMLGWFAVLHAWPLLGPQG